MDSKTRNTFSEANPPRLQRSSLMLIILLTVTIMMACCYYIFFLNPLIFQNKSDTYVFLLAGQSNMAGRGYISEQQQNEFQGVFSLDQNLKIVPARHPLHFDRRTAGYSLGIDFAEQIYKWCGSCKVLLVPAAVGGTSLDDWQPGQPIYNRAIQMTNYAMNYGVLKGIIWHQGETEAQTINQEKLSTYAAKLAILISSLRQDLGSPNLPFVAGTLASFLKDHVGYDNYDQVSAIISQVLHNTAHASLVDASDLDDMGDRIHFSSSALKILGQRYAQSIISLL